MSISKKSNLNGWHKNTELCVNVKTMLLSDVRMKVGKSYQGVLRRDVECEDYRYDEQFTFVETLPWLSKRNPCVFRGKYITVTRRDDGTYRLNFRPLKLGEDFSPERFALGVYNETLWAVEGLIEK